MNKLHAVGLSLGLGAAFLLGGCFGGSDDDTPPVTTQVPGEVNTSATAFITYLKALVVADAAMLEPVDISTVTPATADTSEPDSSI